MSAVRRRQLQGETEDCQVNRHFLSALVEL